MARQLRLLLIEDSPDDAQLLILALSRAGYDVVFERVETADSMRSALALQAWDLIICDYTLPQFNALQALDVLKSSSLDLPFIIVSGTIGEETAVTALKAGANDFLIKGRFARLGPAVQRELRDKAARREQREADEKYRRLVEQLPMIVYINPIDGIGHTIYVSPQVQDILGYTTEEWLADPEFWKKALHPDDHEAVLKKLEEVAVTGIPFEMEYRTLASDGHIVWFHDQAVMISDRNGQPLYWQGLMVDFTQQKRSEEALERQDEELRRRNNEMARLYRASESLLAGTRVTLPDLGAAIVQTVLREFEHSNCSLFLVNRETRELDRLSAEGPYAPEVRAAQLSVDGPGLVPKAIRTGEIINIPDVAVDPDYVSSWKAARSELVVPLKIGPEVIGALDVQSSDPDAFDENDERLMAIFAERAALGMERTRLHEQTLRQLERLGSLRTIDLAISSTFDLRLLLNIVLEQVQTQLKIDAADVLLFHPAAMRLEYISGRGFRSRAIESSSLRLGEGFAGQSAIEKRIVHIADLADHKQEFLRQDLLASENFVSYFAVPLIAKGEVKGVLEIFHRTAIRANMEWLDFLDALGWQTAIAVDNAHLVERIQRSNADLQLAYDATIEGWSHAMDLRDKETEGHTQRVTSMALFLASAMGLGDDQLVHIRRGGLLHDIGKLGVPDGILLKPDQLTEVEWEVMRQHPVLAHKWMSPIKYLQPALEIPYCHHEKWDGSGYPRGLKGELIPLSARIFAVADVWDALTSNRPYRNAWTQEKALDYIQENSGKHFDPQVVEVFLQNLSRHP